MEYEVDTYILEYVENENKYYISFKDSAGNNFRLEIDKEVFDVYMASKKAYTKIKNETSRYLEHSELTDISLYNRSLNKKRDVLDDVVENTLKQELIKSEKELTDTQRRRIQMYYFEDKTLREIAEIEGCAIMSVKDSLDAAIRILEKNLKKFKI